jgi:hypothetical protein
MENVKDIAQIVYYLALSIAGPLEKAIDVARLA